MGRRSFSFTAAVTAGVAAWVSGAQANGTSCGIERARVVKETRTAVIVRQQIRGEFGSRYYGCMKVSGRAVLVARDYDLDNGESFETSEASIRLRGHFAAVVMSGCLVECSPFEIASWDLRTGVRVRLITPKGADVLRLMVSRSGALAYVADSLDRVLVVKADAEGHSVVKRGSFRNLPPSSVHLRRHRLSWEFKGRRQSVRLR